jgi:hypothetical protein
VVRNVPVFRFHGRYYYRPHYCTVLAQAASIQLHKESFADLGKMTEERMRLKHQPRPPTPEKLRLLDFIHGAPKSWWKSLDQYRGHIMLLQQVAGEGTRGSEELLMEWLLRFTGTGDATNVSIG